MSNFSAQDTFTITLDNSTGNYTSVTGSGVTSISSITLTPSPVTYTFSGTNTIDTITLDSSSFSTNYGLEEWRNCFPNRSRIQDMCDQYPGLKIAFEKFKTTYYLVKDDYDTPKTDK